MDKLLCKSIKKLQKFYKFALRSYVNYHPRLYFYVCDLAACFQTLNEKEQLFHTALREKDLTERMGKGDISPFP